MLINQEWQVLAAVDEIGRGEAVTAAEVGTHLHLGQQDVQSLLGRLTQRFYLTVVTAAFTAGGPPPLPPIYGLTDKGRSALKQGRST